MKLLTVSNCELVGQIREDPASIPAFYKTKKEDKTSRIGAENLLNMQLEFVLW